MTEIYIIRHVQAEGNLYRFMQGQWDGDVTALGHEQRERLAARFRDLDLDAVYSSDLYRARFTAEALTRGRDLPILLDRRLREINIGPWEAQPFANVVWDDPETFTVFMTDPEHFELAGAETYHQVRARALEALREIAEENDGRRVAVSSHGITIRCMLTAALGIPLGDTAAVPIFANTGVAHLFYENGAFRLDYLNDDSHLGGLPQISPIKLPALRHVAIDPARERALYCGCYADSWRAAHGDLGGYVDAPYLSAAVAHHRADPASVLALYDETTFAGLVDMDTERGKHANYGWLSLLYLRPEYRRRGLGVQALGRAVSKFEAMGRTALRLHVSEDNEAALAFYRHWGFEELSWEPGARGRLLLMEKKLRGVGHGLI